MYIDVDWEMKTNVSFREEVMAMGQDIATCENKGDTQGVQATLIKLLKKLNFNTSLLTGYFFPKYPKQEPLSLNDRPFAHAMFNIQPGGYICIKGSRQIGKCFASSVSLRVRRRNGQVGVVEDAKTMKAEEVFNMLKASDKKDFRLLL